MVKHHWNTQEGQQRQAKEARKALKIAGNFGSRSAYVREIKDPASGRKIWVTQFGSKRKR